VQDLLEGGRVQQEQERLHTSKMLLISNWLQKNGWLLRLVSLHKLTVTRFKILLI
jgi:hypothetical protein